MPLAILSAVESEIRSTGMRKKGRAKKSLELYSFVGELEEMHETG